MKFETDVNYQESLIRIISNLTFNIGKFDCVIVISKNPQLLSLMCCLETKKTISSPYPLGTNFYYPIEAGKTFKRITVSRYQIENGLSGYWYEEVKGATFSVCRAWKSATEFEKNAVLAKDQNSTDWIRQRNVSNAKLSKHSGQSFPGIVSTSRGFECWLNDEVSNNESLLTLLGFQSFEEFKEAVNFLSPRSVRSSQENNYIWVNSIPELIDNKKHIIFLSPNSSRLEEFNSDINELYINTENKKIWKLDELPQNLQIPVKNCSVATPISMWSIQ